MHRRLYFLFLIVIVFPGACKKDLLHLQNVQQINSYSDSDQLNKILFLNDSIGFIVGGLRFTEAIILSTHDGGYTWQKKSYPVAGKALHDMVRAPSGALYTCGFDGKLLHSNDTGKTWLFNQLEYFSFTGLAFSDATHLLVVGGVSFGSGIREYIDTFGHLLKRDSLPYQFNKIMMTSGQTGYLCGYGVMTKTTDGGKTWNFQNLRKDDFTAMDIHGDEIWVCGYNGGVFHTTNGGGSWERLRNGNDITIPGYHLNGIVFKDSRHGWAVGENGILIYTDDGGHHWAEYDKFTTNALRCIAICPNGDLLVAGDNGALFRIVPR
jgi:photosystem II stability/assembly factor-like uncharacterized protein